MQTFGVGRGSHERHFVNCDSQNVVCDFLLAPQRFTKHSQYSSWGFWPFSSVCIQDPRVPPAPLPSCRPCCVARPAAVSLCWSGKGRRQRGRAAGNTDPLLESAWEAPSVGQHDSHLEMDGRNESVTHRRCDDRDSLEVDIYVTVELLANRKSCAVKTDKKKNYFTGYVNENDKRAFKYSIFHWHVAAEAWEEADIYEFYL